MKTLDKGQDKIQKICEELRRQTLEPAKKEAHEIVEAGKRREREIIAEAEAHAAKLIAEARATIEQERNVFNSSLQQAIKQSLEALRQSIEHKLFDEELQKAIENISADPKIIAHLINSIVTAIDRDGIKTDLSAEIPRTVSVEAVNRFLLENVLKRLREGSVVLGNFSGGAQVKLHNKKITIDMTDHALKELLSTYARKGFRDLIFGKVK